MNISELRRLLRDTGMANTWEQIPNPSGAWGIVIPCSTYGHVYITAQGPAMWGEYETDAEAGRLWGVTEQGQRVTFTHPMVASFDAATTLSQLRARAELAYGDVCNAAAHICFTDDSLCADCGANA